MTVRRYGDTRGTAFVWLLLVAAALTLSSCSSRNAALDNYDRSEPASVPDQTGPNQSDTSTAAGTASESGLVSGPSAVTEAPPEPTGVEDSETAALAEQESASTTNPDDMAQATTTPAGATPSLPPSGDSINPTPLDGLGGELGCQDAQQLRRRMSSTEISDVARTMPPDLWLCTNTVAVTDRLECYPDETAALFDAMQQRMGEAAQIAAIQLRDANAIFCHDPYVIQLGMDGVLGDILDQIDAAEAG